MQQKHDVLITVVLHIFMEQNEDVRNRSVTYGNLTKPACLIPGENTD